MSILRIHEKTKNHSPNCFIWNISERLAMDTATVSGDLFYIPMGIFEAEIVAKISPEKLTGYWKKRRKGTEYVKVNLEDQHSDNHRFINKNNLPVGTKNIDYRS